LDSPWPTTAILIAYLLFVLKLGKIYMAERKPYNIKNVIIGYNIFQVIYNVIMFGFVSSETYTYYLLSN